MSRPWFQSLIRLAWLTALLLAAGAWRSLGSSGSGHLAPRVRVLRPSPSPAPPQSRETTLLQWELDGRAIRLVRAADSRLWAYIDDACWTSDTRIPFTSLVAAERIAAVRIDPAVPPAWVEVETTVGKPGDTPTIFRVPAEGVRDVVRRLARATRKDLTVATPLTLKQGGRQTWVWYYARRGLRRDDRIEFDVHFIRR